MIHQRGEPVEFTWDVILLVMIHQRGEPVEFTWDVILGRTCGI